MSELRTSLHFLWCLNDTRSNFMKVEIIFSPFIHLMSLLVTNGNHPDL